MLKRVDQLVHGDIIVEKRQRTSKYKVTGIKVAACSAHKTHVVIDGARQWCYDSAFEVEVQKHGTIQIDKAEAPVEPPGQVRGAKRKMPRLR